MTSRFFGFKRPFVLKSAAHRARTSFSTHTTFSDYSQNTGTLVNQDIHHTTDTQNRKKLKEISLTIKPTQKERLKKIQA